MKVKYMFVAAALLLLAAMPAATVVHAADAGPSETTSGDATPEGADVGDDWDPELDASVGDDWERQEAAGGSVSISVNYTSGIEAQEGDVFHISYQVVGSDLPATISLNADEIDGYVGEVAMPDGTYEIVDVQYDGKNPDIRSYGIENTFTVGNGTGDGICLTIGKDGVLSLMGEDGYFLHVDDEEKIEDETEGMDEAEAREEAEREEKEHPKAKAPSPVRAVPVVLVAVILVIGIVTVKKKGILDH